MREALAIQEPPPPSESRNPGVMYKSSSRLEFLGAESRNRTGDTRIFSPVLYQLSYLGSYLVGDAGLEPAASTL